MKSKKITSRQNHNDEIFNQLSEDWWSNDGPFEALHTFNFIRIEYIKKFLKKNSLNSIDKIKILDVGCGGGILCEPLARLGAKIIGIDVNEKAIKSAKNHSFQSNLKIKYHCTDISKFNCKEKFDLITCMEVLEHVNDVELVVKNIKRLLKKNGIFIGSTINRTFQSLILAIFVAEKILKLVPQKTHSWEKLVKPNFLKKILLSQNFYSINFQGVSYNPLTKNWKYKESCNINYFFSARAK
tara:strand:- start:2127 stop:2849 length:723 start_codon:yes stop_codon:yes gene_type:complete